MKKLLLSLYTGSASLLSIAVMCALPPIVTTEQNAVLCFLILLTMGSIGLFANIITTPAEDFNNWN